MPAGEISDSNLSEILEQRYEGRTHEDRESLNSMSNNILDSAVQATETSTRTSTINEQAQAIKNIEIIKTQEQRQTMEKEGKAKGE